MLLKLFNFSSWFKLVTRRMKRRLQELRFNFCHILQGDLSTRVLISTEVTCMILLNDIHSLNIWLKTKHSKTLLLPLTRGTFAYSFLSYAHKKRLAVKGFCRAVSLSGWGAPRPHPHPHPRLRPRVLVDSRFKRESSLYFTLINIYAPKTDDCFYGMGFLSCAALNECCFIFFFF